MTQLSRTEEVAVVTAARAGDSGAMSELARCHLPFVYRLVWQAMPGDPDVDDVVQDIMLRAFQRLPSLRDPGSFRPWLAATAFRQIAVHRARGNRREGRAAPLDDAIGRPDAAAEVEGPALLRADLATQRRQIGHATRWMGTRERAVYSLWSLETVGELTRVDTARAMGENVASTGVRVQRMREQLELSRRVVAALEASPGCTELEGVVAGWDSVPSAFWRKRIGRHVRSCPVCAQATGDLVPVERLLAGLALVTAPAALAGAVLAKTFAAGGAGHGATAGATSAATWLGGAAQAIGAHPVVATVGAVVLAAGVVVPTNGWTASGQPRQTISPAPSRPAGLLSAGRMSLESAEAAGSYVSASGDRGLLTQVGPSSGAAARQQATLLAVAGIADPACSSFRGQDGRYLRHSSFRLRMNPDEGTVLFRRDATFCPRAGFTAGSIALESKNYPGFFVRHLGAELWIDQYDGSADFRAQSSFFIRGPLA
ncbi:AbfB domain-containing protein [Actinoplanes sp. NPDC049668]|uniref:AbfB domain-containing protein n=1 Tax=unclassified Actinoplanes TaxID=2626549 RepID=UPI0033B4021A